MKTNIKLILLLMTFITFGCDKKVENKTVQIKQNISNAKDTVVWVSGDYKNDKKTVTEYLKYLIGYSLKDKVLIENQQELISFAEPILFKVFGKDLIISERPYKISLIDNYWYMTGSMNSKEVCVGGTFVIIVNRKTCEVKFIIHEE